MRTDGLDLIPVNSCDLFKFHLPLLKSTLYFYYSKLQNMNHPRSL